MAREIDETDRRILRALEQDGRLSMRALAETLHISRANAYARVERLREQHVIRAFRADVDPAAFGLGTTAYVTLNLEQTSWKAIREQLRTLDGVAQIALVGGDFDVLLLVRVKDNVALRQLVLDQIQGIAGVRNTRTLLVFEEAEPLPPVDQPDPPVRVRHARST